MTQYTQTGYQVATSLGACLALSALFVILRFSGRVYRKQSPFLADYVILVGLLAFIAYAGVLFAMVNSDGSIEPSELTNPGAVSRVFHYTIITQTLFVLVISLVKISILLFYRAIFTNTAFRKINNVAIVICVIWFLVTFFVLIFQCSPVTATWDFADLMKGAKCVELPNMILGTEITNICIDVMIMALPCLEMRKLQMKTSKKVKVSFVFVIGGFVAVASGLRIGFTRPHGRLGPTILVNFTQTYVWTNIQMAAAFICACLPTMPELFPKSPWDAVSSMRSWLSGLVSKNHSNSVVPHPSDEKSGSANSFGNSTKVVVGTVASNESDSLYGHDGVRVEGKVSVV